MAIVGFSFSKFDASRASAAKAGGIEVKHNISVKNVAKTQLNLGSSKSDVLKIDFSFDVLYGDGLGKITIEGDVVYSDTAEIVEETFKSWEADKKLNSMVNEQVFKFVFGKVIVKSLELADSLGLPSPVPLPKLDFSAKKSSN